MSKKTTKRQQNTVISTTKTMNWYSWFYMDTKPTVYYYKYVFALISKYLDNKRRHVTLQLNSQQTSSDTYVCFKAMAWSTNIPHSKYLSRFLDSKFRTV